MYAWTKSYPKYLFLVHPGMYGDLKDLYGNSGKSHCWENMLNNTYRLFTKTI